jgi:hypothetical protein
MLYIWEAKLDSTKKLKRDEHMEIETDSFENFE